MDLCGLSRLIATPLPFERSGAVDIAASQPSFARRAANRLAALSVWASAQVRAAFGAMRKQTSTRKHRDLPTSVAGWHAQAALGSWSAL